MIIVNKKIGETPLELIGRIRKQNKKLEKEKMSYAGRLDPMASGKMLILVGDENKNRQKYLNLDKEYIATFLVGLKTDTGDILGIIENTDLNTFSSVFYEKIANKNDLQYEIKRSTDQILSLKTQTYPWFSGKTVDGKKLFDHYKAENFDIQRPTKKIKIKKAEFLNIKEIKVESLKKYIFQSIHKVSGEFRQKEILNRWQKMFENLEREELSELPVFEVKFLVTSGTFIRGLTENFEFPTMLLKLKRTKIYV